MHRNIIHYFINWKQQTDRLPLLVRGARQVGKTYVIEQFGQKYYEDMFKINFEQQREFIDCFNTLYPEKILALIYAISGKSVIPGKTLLFLDEIQECPNAITALRYFYEQLPQQHIISAGSLLEFTMRKPDFKMPVGRVQSCYMKPMSFVEFLLACGKNSLLEYLKDVHIKDGVSSAVHQQLLLHLREYLVLGGMPAVLKNYFGTKNLEECQIRQGVILENYRTDFGKYAKHTNIKYLQALFDKAPGSIAKHFQYSAIDPHMHSRDLKRALTDLMDAGIIYTCHATSASGLPLITTINEKKFKCFFVDVGLVNNSTRLSAEILMSEKLILLHRGAIAEQFVAQELLAYAPYFRDEQLFYWEKAKKTSTAEVDFVTAIDSTILPLEVKSGSTGRLKSLQIFLDEKSIDFGVRISQNTLSFENKVLSIPLYLLSELPRIIKQIG